MSYAVARTARLQRSVHRRRQRWQVGVLHRLKINNTITHLPIQVESNQAEIEQILQLLGIHLSRIRIDECH